MIYETVKGFVIMKWLVDKLDLIWFSCFVCLMTAIFFYCTVKQLENFYHIKCYVPPIRTS